MVSRQISPNDTAGLVKVVSSHLRAEQSELAIAGPACGLVD